MSIDDFSTGKVFCFVLFCFLVCFLFCFFVFLFGGVCFRFVLFVIVEVIKFVSLFVCFADVAFSFT